MRKSKDDYYNLNFEKFKKFKLKPKGARNLKQLILSESEAKLHDEPSTFKDYGLESLFEEGHLKELIGVIRSGKEATVYLAKGSAGYIAIKIYADRDSILFRKKEMFYEGRHILNKRYRKAVQNNSKIGRGVSQGLWIEEEYRNLTYLYSKGIPVPKPISQVERVIAMKLIGNNERPAPRLSDLNLNDADSRFAFKKSVEILGNILKSGRVHGDYSTFNLLWHNENIVVIDFPQTVEIHKNQNFKYLLNKDISSLCKSFKRLGVNANESHVLAEVLEISSIDLSDFH